MLDTRPAPPTAIPARRPAGIRRKREPGSGNHKPQNYDMLQVVGAGSASLRSAPRDDKQRVEFTTTRLAAALLALCFQLSVFAATALASDLVRVGEAPFHGGGPFYIARDKGYFKKLNLDIETRHFVDGSSAARALIAGELDFALTSPDASLFNSMAKGAPVLVVLDGGRNRRGFGSTVINVTQALHEGGLNSVRDFDRLKGKKFGVPAIGSVNQYNAAFSLMKAKLDPAKDVEWIADGAQTELMRMLGSEELAAADIAYQLGLLAQNAKWGPIIINDDVIVPDAQISIFAAHRDFLGKSRDAAVRFAMAYLHATKDFNAAAIDPGPRPDIVEILAQSMPMGTVELVRASAPNWSYIAEDGVPLANSILNIQDFWSGKHFNLVEKKVSRQQLFEFNIAKDAKARLAKEKPFGN
jgi:NitT/TauT family transport system substrate-binding protein